MERGLKGTWTILQATEGMVGLLLLVVAGIMCGARFYQAKKKEMAAPGRSILKKKSAYEPSSSISSESSDSGSQKAKENRFSPHSESPESPKSSSPGSDSSV